MSDYLTDRLADIQKRAETAADGNFIQRAQQESELINSDIPFLLDIVRKQQDELDSIGDIA